MRAPLGVTDIQIEPPPQGVTSCDVAVVGAGPAGLAAALGAAARGHAVTLFEQATEIGGQLNMAKVVPGKEEFYGLVDWFGTMIDKHGVGGKLQVAS